MSEESILVVDDEPDMLSICRKILATDYRVYTCDDALNALELLKAKGIDLLVIDLKLGGMDGLEIMEEAQHIRPGISVIIITAYPTSESAARAVRQGACDYLSKPFTAERLLTSVERCFMYRNVKMARREGSPRKNGAPTQ